jgi:linoleoyl-CoA desaturase
MVLKTITLYAILIVPYALILTGRFSGLAMLGLTVVMGVGMAGIGFSVAHDALHGAYAERAWVNRLMGYSFDILGANGYMWKFTHNVVHHTYTNIQGVDGDLEVSPYLRLSPRSAYRPIHRYQHLYAFAAYSLSTLVWVLIKDYKYFLRGENGPHRGKKLPAVEIVTLVITKLFYYGWAIVIPIIVLHLAWWQIILGFLTFHLTAGIILGIIFQLAHVVEQTAHPTPTPSGAMEHAWLLHELETTADFGQNNHLLTWYVGGLNYQIEHHLFPRVCSIHYPAISRIVRELAAEYGMPYHVNPTLRAAIASHVRVLRELGRGATELPAAA